MPGWLDGPDKWSHSQRDGEEQKMDGGKSCSVLLLAGGGVVAALVAALANLRGLVS